MSPRRSALCSACATAWSARSPAWWPALSLRSLKWSMSQSATPAAIGRRCVAASDLAERAAMAEAGERIGRGAMAQLGDGGGRAQAARGLRGDELEQLDALGARLELARVGDDQRAQLLAARAQRDRDDRVARRTRAARRAAREGARRPRWPVVAQEAPAATASASPSSVASSSASSG